MSSSPSQKTGTADSRTDRDGKGRFVAGNPHCWGAGPERLFAEGFRSGFGSRSGCLGTETRRIRPSWRFDAYGAKYHKAVERLTKDRERLLTFYDFPAEHWKHIRTTNPIESTFATVRLRTVKTKGCLSRKTALAMTFKLILSAKHKWRKLDASNQLAEVIQGVPFKDGKKQTQCAA